MALYLLNDVYVEFLTEESAVLVVIALISANHTCLVAKQFHKQFIRTDFLNWQKMEQELLVGPEVENLWQKVCFLSEGVQGN